MPQDIIKKSKKIEKKLEKLLDISPIPMEEKEIIQSPEVNEITVYNSQEISVSEPIAINFENDLEQDYIKARNSLTKSLENTDRMIASIMSFAREGESARVYEVAGILIKTRADISMQLVELHERINSIKNKNGDSTNWKNPNGTTNIQNAVIVNGTTQEILDNIEKSRKSR